MQTLFYAYIAITFILKKTVVYIIISVLFICWYESLLTIDHKGHTF